MTRGDGMARRGPNGGDGAGGAGTLRLTREEIDRVSERVYALLLEELRLDAEREGRRGGARGLRGGR